MTSKQDELACALASQRTRVELLQAVLTFEFHHLLHLTRRLETHSLQYTASVFRATCTHLHEVIREASSRIRGELTRTVGRYRADIEELGRHQPEKKVLQPSDRCIARLGELLKVV